MCSQGGYYWFNLIDVFIGGFPLLIVGLVEIIALIYIYGTTIFSLTYFNTKRDQNFLMFVLLLF